MRVVFDRDGIQPHNPFGPIYAPLRAVIGVPDFILATA
jgi:hypothetical protein